MKQNKEVLPALPLEPPLDEHYAAIRTIWSKQNPDRPK
jgi:hypothetical protein